MVRWPLRESPATSRAHSASYLTNGADVCTPRTDTHRTRPTSTTLTDELETLLTDAEERGYVLTSQLVVSGPTDDDDTWVQDAAQHARDRGLTVVDDLADGDDAATNEPHAMADPVRWYLDRAASHELLDAQQEMDLAKRYRAGIEAQQLLDTRDLTTTQRRTLRRLAADGRRAKETLIASNLRLVVPTAKRYAGRDLDLLEAIQEANVGLIRAVEKFDHTRGYKFSTYAVWWIRQASQRGLSSQSRTIRVPASVWEDRAKVRRAQADLRTELGSDPDVEQVAELTGLRPDRIRDVERALQPMTSLDRPVGEDGDAAFGDLLPDEGADDPASLSARTDAYERLHRLLGDLDPRERSVLELRYGLVDGRTRTYAEIGDELGLGREVARQLNHRATEKLRTSEAAAQLRTLAERAA